MKKLSIVLALVFVFCFSSLVFAQNANSSTTTNDSSASMATKHGRRRHARRRHARRRHGRRRSMKMAANSNMTTGNANK